MGKPLREMLRKAPPGADLLRQDWPNDRCDPPTENPNLDRYEDED